MSVGRCKICDDLIFDWREHKCDSEWLVMSHDDIEDIVHIDEMIGEDGKHDFYHVFGSGVQEAAENFCSRYYGDWDYPESMEIIIIDEHGCPHQYQIFVETVPEFSAYEVK